MAENHGIQFSAKKIEFEEHGGVERVKTEVSSMESGIHGSLGCGEVDHGSLEAVQAGVERFGICH